MEKLVFFINRAPDLDRTEFGRRYLESHAPLTLQHCPKLRGYVVNIGDVGKESEGAFDAITELWFDSLEDFTDRSRLYDSPEGASAVAEDGAALVRSAIGYRVVEGIQRDYDRSWSDGEPSPGVKMMAPLLRAEGLSHDGFADHWLNTHVPLALEHLPGMWRYVTNIVTAPLTPNAPEYDGVIGLHVRELADMDDRERFYASPEGVKIMADDSSKLLARVTRTLTTEHVLRRPPSPQSPK